MRRLAWLDAVRGVAVLWMTAYHFAFDLNYFGWIHQDFYRDPVWTWQRTGILSLFLLSAGAGQALAHHHGQTWGQFWRRWRLIALGALAVSVGSALMFPRSWIYLGVLHGMALMLPLCRASAGAGWWLYPAAAAAVALPALAPVLHAQWPALQVLDTPAWNWLGMIRHKPVTEDYVPLLPWLGVMWCGLALGQRALGCGWLSAAGAQDRKGVPVSLGLLVWAGRHSLAWYMLHQPMLMGLLFLVGWLVR